jgi:putative phage-type endonuclease
MIIEVLQGSLQWLELRQRKITATDSATILGLNPWESPVTPWRRKLGLMEPVEINDAMRKGNELEPIARNKLNEMLGIDLKPAVVIHEKYNWMMSSMDGISEDHKIACEIKCGEKSFIEAKKGNIPKYYYCQMQHQMKTLEINEIIYYCYIENNDTMIKVKRDDDFINNMVIKEEYYFNCLINLREPNLYECTA